PGFFDRVRVAALFGSALEPFGVALDRCRHFGGAVARFDQAAAVAGHLFDVRVRVRPREDDRIGKGAAGAAGAAADRDAPAADARQRLERGLHQGRARVVGDRGGRFAAEAEREGPARGTYPHLLFLVAGLKGRVGDVFEAAADVEGRVGPDRPVDDRG